jgi:hypothetical protein
MGIWKGSGKRTKSGFSYLENPLFAALVNNAIRASSRIGAVTKYSLFAFFIEESWLTASSCASYSCVKQKWRFVSDAARSAA